MKWSRSLLSALLLQLVATAVAAEQPVSRPWQVDWGQYYCSLIPRPPADSPYQIAILSVPGSNSTQILIMSEASAPLPKGITSVVLGPGGRTYEVAARREFRGNRAVLILYSLPYEFREALAGVSDLQLKAGADIRVRFPLADPRGAIAAHRRCTAEISREWGVDEEALAALSQPPASTNLMGLSSNDYPASALRTATQGRVIVRIDVSSGGRATDCAPVATSGNAAIDATTCRVILRRARFRPGLDATGQPIAARMISTVTWLLPDRY